MVMKRPMVAFLTQLLLAIQSRFTRRARLEAENLILRQQLVVLQRKSPTRVRLWNIDRLLLVWLHRLYPSLLDAIIIVQPETVIRWHRRGFRAYWRWKSRHVGGRPRIDSEMRALIRRMSLENPLWGAPRIHGELLMLGIEVAESTVGSYMVRRRRPPSRGWKTFLRNHAACIASLDLFVVRTISFKLLYGLVILRHARKRLVAISVTTNPTAEWIAGQRAIMSRRVMLDTGRPPHAGSRQPLSSLRSASPRRSISSKSRGRQVLFGISCVPYKVVITPQTLQRFLPSATGY
jgi:hypothetical protein